MRKIVVSLETGYPSTNAQEYLLVPEDINDVELDKVAQRRALMYAATYGVHPYSEDVDYDQDEDADEQGIELSYDIYGYWEEYNPAIHGVFGAGFWVELDEQV